MRSLTRRQMLGLSLGGLGLLLPSACSKHSLTPGAQTTDVSAADIDYYTCTMHPSVHSKVPGKCPICGMELVPVRKQDAKATGTGSVTAEASDAPKENTEFQVPVERQQLIGVTYAAVVRKQVEINLRRVGRAEVAADKSFSYVARVDGYVQDLKVSSPGQSVTQGQPLLVIYSPDLRSTEEELVKLLNGRDRATGMGREAVDPLIQAAEARLRQWNIGETEIVQVENSRQASATLTLRSPFNGVVSQVMTQPGANVKTGDKLIEVLDLSMLWVWAEFYEDDIGLLKLNQSLEITMAAFPEETFRGQIAALNPTVDPNKRTVQVRIDLPNPRGDLRPGMYANVMLRVDGGESLAIPAQAVLPTGERMLVFVDRGQGNLLPCYVKLGRLFSGAPDDQGNTDYYQVLSGLTDGEKVVASANFLIDAESQVQGALKDFVEPRKLGSGRTRKDSHER
jgi:membrane fusion protein, copper/silver efflux system